MGTVASLLAEHVGFRCTSVDRVGIRGYVPALMYEGGVVKFLVERGNTIPSPAVLNRNHQRLVGQLDALVAAIGGARRAFQGRPIQGGHRPPLPGRGRPRRAGSVWCWSARPRSATASWRGFVDNAHPAHRPNHPHITWRRQSSMPDHWYFYFADAEWGPASLRLCSYAPYPLWCQRQRA